MIERAIKWSPVLVGLAAGGWILFSSTRPAVARMVAIRGEIAATQREVEPWRWVEGAEIPEEPSVARPPLTLAGQVESVTTRVRAAQVRLIRLGPRTGGDGLDLEVKGGYPGLLRLLEAFRGTDLEVSSVKKDQDGRSVVAALRFRAD